VQFSSPRVTRDQSETPDNICHVSRGEFDSGIVHEPFFRFPKSVGLEIFLFSKPLRKPCTHASQCDPARSPVAPQSERASRHAGRPTPEAVITVSGNVPHTAALLGSAARTCRSPPDRVSQMPDLTIEEAVAKKVSNCA
jgi:hypothetical protein